MVGAYRGAPRWRGPLRPVSSPPFDRRGARVVDRVCLENRSTRKGTGGSNPSLSADRKPLPKGGFCAQKRAERSSSERMRIKAEREAQAAEGRSLPPPGKRVSRNPSLSTDQHSLVEHSSIMALLLSTPVRQGTPIQPGLRSLQRAPERLPPYFAPLPTMPHLTLPLLGPCLFALACATAQPMASERQPDYWARMIWCAKTGCTAQRSGRYSSSSVVSSWRRR